MSVPQGREPYERLIQEPISKNHALEAREWSPWIHTSLYKPFIQSGFSRGRSGRSVSLPEEPWKNSACSGARLPNHP